MRYIICPKCKHEGSPVEFLESCASECECPECGENFVVDWDNLEDEEDDEPGT